MSSGGLPSLDPLSGPIPELAYPRLETAAADQLLTSLRDCSDTWGAGATVAIHALVERSGKYRPRLAHSAARATVAVR
jgi:hypothetical protein